MKTTLLSILSFFLVFTIVYAQEEDKDMPIRFGPKAGVSFATITGDDTDDIMGITSFHIGAVVEFPISDVFSIQPEVIYSRQGAEQEESYMDSGFNVTEEGEITLDYILVPIMAKYYVTDGLSVEVGPQVGFLINSEAEASATLTGMGTTMTMSETYDLKDRVKSIDFGVNFGLGYCLDNGINFAARYNLGITDGNDDPEFFGSDSAFMNSVFQISIGYFFK